MSALHPRVFRLKNGKEHQVPLSPLAVAVLERMSEIINGEYVFFGQSSGRPLSNMALLVLLRRMKLAGVQFGFDGFFRLLRGHGFLAIVGVKTTLLQDSLHFSDRCSQV